MTTPRAPTATWVPGISEQTDVDLAFAAGRAVTLRRSDRPPGLLMHIADELHARGLWQPLLDAMGEKMRDAVQFALADDYGRSSRHPRTARP